MMTRQWWPALLSAAILAGGQASLFADENDPLPAVRDRMKIEAQRLEKEFREERAAAYKLVRSATPRLVEATEKLQSLLAMIRKDDSLDEKRRKVLLVTLEWDLDKVKEIAGARRQASTNSSLARETRSGFRRDYAERRDSDERRTADSRSMTRDARSIIESRSRDVTDSRTDRSRFSDRFNRVGRSVEKAAIPESRGYVLPKDWAEKSQKRGTGIKMTVKEKAILAALKKYTGVDYVDLTFEEVIDLLKKETKCDIVVDKRALDEAGVKYESKVNLKMRASTRTILKRILGDLGLAYVVKDEAILITSAERARQMTTVRTYYIRDLADVVDVRIPPGIRQLLMIQNVNQIISMVTNNYDRQSWQVNNPEAPGSIAFNPITMTLTVKQTAEVHFMLGGK